VKTDIVLFTKDCLTKDAPEAHENENAEHEDDDDRYLKALVS